MIIYTRPSCAPCRTLLYYLDKKGIKYQKKEPDASIKIVPTIELAGQRIEGLDFQRLVRLLAAQKLA